jgi:SprT protein
MDEVQAIVSSYIQMARDYFDEHIDDPQISFKLRGTSIAGQAWYSKWLLKFHMGFLKENEEHYLTRTVPHEVAHLVARRISLTKGGRVTPNRTKWDFNLKRMRIKPHGAEWKFIMEKVFKIPAKRCHSYEIPEGYERKKRIFVYACECRSFKLSIIRHNRTQRLGGSFYNCKRCGQSLVFKEEI